MLIADIVRLSTRMFRTNRSRTFLTILGISIGIAAILFLVSLGYGLQELILNKITTSDALLSLDVSTGDLEKLRLNKESVKKIKEIQGIDKISPVISTQSQITIDDIFSELSVNFVDREFFKLDGTILKNGEFYEDDDSSKDKIIISSAALKLFNLDEKACYNKQIYFTFFKKQDDKKETFTRDFIKINRAFKIIGIIEEENSNYVYMPFSVSNELDEMDYSKIKVKVNKKESLDLVRDKIIEQGFIVSALSDIIEQANQIFKVVQIVLASFGVVALAVSAIGMFNTMTIALLERTQEIGIMKALGATSSDIWKMFLAESVLIGFLGGLGGIIIGMLGGSLFNYGLNLLAGAMGGEKIDMFYTPVWFILLIIIFSTVVGLMTGFYPAKRAAKINALEALRYK